MNVKDRNLPLLRAHPHQWGSGHVHLIDPDRDQTICGQSPARCPGDKFHGTLEQVTCKACHRSLETKARWAEEAQQRQQRQREREEQAGRWWDAYNLYLSSPDWHHKRALVLRRAAGLCEGCGMNRATQVHHRKYPRGCAPGSEEWLAQEKLFDLIAICDECHEDVHADYESGGVS